MTAVGLGLAALGRPGYINLGHGDDVGDGSVEGMERAAYAVLDAAWEGGVRHFDAARSYGRAEAILAGWLRARERRPEDLVVSSKWGYRYTAGWRVDAEHHEIKELSAAQLRRQWRESSALLRRAPRPLPDPLGDARERRAGRRRRRRRAGRAARDRRPDRGERDRPDQAATIDRALAVGGFDEVQATWNLHERSAASALARAHDAGLEVYVKEALANGRLTARGAHPALAAAARERGVGEDQIALAAALAQPWAGVVLSGAATVEQLASNLGATGVAWDAELEQRARAAGGAAANLLGTPRSRLAWN